MRWCPRRTVPRPAPRPNASGPAVPGPAPPFLGLRQQLVAPRPVAAVVPGEQREPDRVRVDVGGPQLGDEDQVAPGLGHLLPVEPDHARVHVVPGERVLAGQRLRVGGAVLVVREDQVGAAALHVERGAEPVERDGAALDVPAGTARAEVRGPRGLVGARHAPEQRVERVALAGAVRVAAALGEEPQHGLLVVVRLVAEPTGDGVVEVQVGVLGVVDPVGRAVRDELGDGLHDLRDRLDRADVLARRHDPERFHVLAEQRGLAHAQHDPVVLVAGGPLQQRVVDVRDVLHVVHVVAVVEPHPVDEVEGEVGGRVPEVRRVVRRDAADVRPGGGARRGGADLARGRVEQPQGPRFARYPRHRNGRPGLHAFDPNPSARPRRTSRPLGRWSQASGPADWATRRPVRCPP